MGWDFLRLRPFPTADVIKEQCILPAKVETAMAETKQPINSEEQAMTNQKQEVEMNIGEQLRNQRKARGITLVEVAEHTKIGKKYLEALEEDCYDMMPCETYIRGFLRAYAKYLELDDENLIKQYQQSRDDQMEEERPEEVSEEKVRKNNQNVWVPLLVMLLLAGAGAGVFLLWPNAPEELVTSHEVMLSDSLAPGFEDFNPARVPGPDEPMTLKIRGKEKTWVTIMADGRQEPDITLNPGEERLWSAQERFVLWTGNAGGIEVTFNGELQPPLGKDGEVCKEVVFERPELILEPEMEIE